MSRACPRFMTLFKQYYDLYKDEGHSEGEVVEELMDTFCLERAQVYNNIRAMKFMERMSKRLDKPLEDQLHPSACVIIDSAPPEEQEKLAIETIEKGLTVRGLKERIEKLKEPTIITKEDEDLLPGEDVVDEEKLEEWTPPPLPTPEIPYETEQTFIELMGLDLETFTQELNKRHGLTEEEAQDTIANLKQKYLGLWVTCYDEEDKPIKKFQELPPVTKEKTSQKPPETTDKTLDQAMKYYPSPLVDIAWTHIQAPTKRITFLKALIETIWEEINIIYTLEVIEGKLFSKAIEKGGF